MIDQKFDQRVQELKDKRHNEMASTNAQNIFDELTGYSNSRGKYEKRWVWELLQNAQDATLGRLTRIEINLTNGLLSFSHNGDSFKDSEIIHLVYHGSTKKDVDGMTGKFGTGFLTTHMLSRKVMITGNMEDEVPFQFTLDRSGETYLDIKNAMDSSFDSYTESMMHTPTNSLSNGFTTQFLYQLDDEGARTARVGLQDLKRVAPIVLALNPKLDSIVLFEEAVCQVLCKNSSSRVSAAVNLAS